MLKRGSTRAWCRIASWITALTLGLMRLTWAGTLPCDRGLSYFQSSARGIEWRVYDPERRIDALFLTVQATPTEMVWDTAFTRVDFFIGRTLYRAPWHAGSYAGIVTRFPESPDACYWWFNPDSACWQFATKRVDLHIPAREYPSASACRSELWQSSRDGQRWRFVLADTAVLDMDECGLSENSSSRIRREPSVTLEEFAPSLSDVMRTDDPYPSPDSTTDSTDWERFYVPLESAPGMGVEMYYWWSAAPQWTVSGPAWLVDSAAGTRRELCAPATGPYGEHDSLMISEACGLLLVWYRSDPLRIVDARTGRDLKCIPKVATSVMVTPRLRP
jgi:hypothetical protein